MSLGTLSIAGNIGFAIQARQVKTRNAAVEFRPLVFAINLFYVLASYDQFSQLKL